MHKVMQVDAYNVMHAIVLNDDWGNLMLLVYNILDHKFYTSDNTTWVCFDHKFAGDSGEPGLS